LKSAGVPERSKTFFGQTAEHYDEWYTVPSAKYAEEVEDNLIFKALEGLSGSVLEVGSGTGNYLRKLKMFGSKYGVDLSMDMLNLSKRKIEIPLVNGRAESLPFKDNSFDVVIGVTSIEFFDGLESGLREIARVAARYVVFGFLSKPSLLYFSRKVRNVFSKNEFAFYNPQAASGLRVFFETKIGGFKVDFAESTLLLFPIYLRITERFFKVIDLNFTKTGIGGFTVMRLFKTGE